ncbi:Thaumatin-like protein [Apostasia shenzhenica]|uniref:Thaumatin-like protein n=1 Tax=Apostasia shenzhenica TaxID=1088818 RepID=A0A2I0B602_9ASPA|nr:Thaumatin-like protein [Apostasia shenzhenica]
MAIATSKLHLLFVFVLFSISPAHLIQLTLVNNCDGSIWPATLGRAGNVSPKDGGFHLGAGEQAVFNVPSGWSGRIWGRQGCCFDEQGKGSCETGDCGGGRLRCKGSGGAPPATLVEMTFGTPQSPVHYYDVSLVDGFNLPVTMTPTAGTGRCGAAACEANLNSCCPSRFEVRAGGRVVGCKSACLALEADKYCCSGEYSAANTCKPTLFSHLFKAICPKAYSFAYDDQTSLNTCRASSYVITFCPARR